MTQTKWFVDKKGNLFNCQKEEARYADGGIIRFCDCAFPSDKFPISLYDSEREALESASCICKEWIKITESQLSRDTDSLEITKKKLEWLQSSHSKIQNKLEEIQ